MSRDPRKPYGMGPRDRDRDRDRWLPSSYRRHSPSRKRSRSRSPPRRDLDGRRPRSPRRNDKDVLDENILSEISKLPEPSELWEPTQQNQEGNFGNAAAPPPPSFRAEPGNPNYSSYQSSYSGIYDDFPTAPSTQQIPPEIASWNQMSLPPPPPPYVNIEDQIKKEAAIESEMRHQKAALSKQREDYIKKAGILKKELDTLKDQRNELRGDTKRSPSPDTKRFLKENTKLQLEIQNKLKTINNVVDMLNGIIGEEAQDVAQESDDSDRGSKRKSRSPSSNKKVNYVYYDPEMHWCRVCNEFPPTAKDYLNHLHSQAHHKMAAAHMEAPWHSVTGVNEGFPSYPAAPTKRTPIRGLQFFVPSTAWYCKLCDQFIGDLHCASAHLKSIQHSKNYTNFVEQNPHWETDWMSDRQKAFEKSRAGKKPEEKPQQYAAHTITFHKDGFHTKRKDNSPPPPEKKRKKEKKKKNKRKQSSSSSATSNSSSSDSEEDRKKKKSKKKFEADEKTLSQWMSAIQSERLTENDRRILDTLKNRLKVKQENKSRSPERSTQEREHSNSESRKTRERERERERESEHRERGARGASARDEARRRSPSRADAKKPEIKKMPFIGKMPVYKHLGKNAKAEEQKKEEQKKKEEEEATKKRREEMDAEIQKKVAEFKEKIARAQLERQAQVELPPPGIALPQQLAAPPPALAAPAPPPAYLPQPTPPAPPPQPVAPAQPPPPATPVAPTLPKDFQEALDIIFPTQQVKEELAAQDGLFGIAPGLPPGFPMQLGGIPSFPPLFNPQMFGFDLNAPLFPPRPQLYDTHVPLAPSPKPRPNKPKNDYKHKQKQQQKQQQHQQPTIKEEVKQEPKTDAQNNVQSSQAKKKEEMDDLAMLGIDVSDVGANI